MKFRRDGSRKAGGHGEIRRVSSELQQKVTERSGEGRGGLEGGWVVGRKDEAEEEDDADGEKGVTKQVLEHAREKGEERGAIVWRRRMYKLDGWRVLGSVERWG